MMATGGLPFSQQLLLDLFMPPLGALVWMFMVRWWAATLQGGDITERTRRRQKKAFWVVLVIAYLTMFGVTFYARWS